MDAFEATLSKRNETKKTRSEKHRIYMQEYRKIDGYKNKHRLDVRLYRLRKKLLDERLTSEQRRKMNKELRALQKERADAIAFMQSERRKDK